MTEGKTFFTSWSVSAFAQEIDLGVFMQVSKDLFIMTLFCLQFFAAITHSASCLDGFMLFGADQASLGKDNQTSGGKIGTNGNLAFGTDNKQTGSIRAGGNITVGGESLINGDVIAGGTISIASGAKITGKKYPNTPSTSCSIASENIPTGTSDLSLGSSFMQTLQPGTYRNITLGASSTLKLVAGNYYFQSLNLGQSSNLNFNTGSGAIQIFIKNSFQFSSDNHFQLTNESKPENIRFYYANTSTLYIGADFEFKGTIVAPVAEVRFLKDAKLFGGCYAKKLTIDADVKITAKPFTMGSSSVVVKITSPVNGLLTNLSTLPVSWVISEVLQTTQNTEALLVEGTNKIKRCSGTICDSINVIRDQTPPVVLITLPKGGIVTSAGSIDVAWTVDGVVQTTLTTENLMLGVNTINRSATDAAGNVNRTSLQVTRVAANSVPLSQPDAYTVKAGDSLAVAAPGVLANDHDSDGDAMKTLLISTVKHGTLVLNQNGTFSYKPVLGFAGLDSMTYRVTDGKDTSAGVLVVLTVVHTPIDLLITSPTNGTWTRLESVIVNYTINNGARIKNYPLIEGVNVVTVDTTDDLGQVISASVTVKKDTVAPVVTIVFPENGFVTSLGALNVAWKVDGILQSVQTTENMVLGANTVARTSTDSAGNAGSASVSVTRVKLNSAPVGVGNVYTVNAGDSINVLAPGVLGNDTDADSDAMTAILIKDVKFGKAVWKPDGSFSYKPAFGFYGPDSLFYRVTDGKDTSALTSVVITVNHTPINLVITLPANNFLTRNSSIVLNYTLNGALRMKAFTLVEGSNTLTVDTLDDLGHGVSASVLVRLDTTPPVVTIVSPTNSSYSSQPSINVEWLVDGVNQLDQLSESLSEGINLITRSTIDSAGNQGSASITITRDSKSPIVKITKPSQDTVVTSASIVLNYTVDSIPFSKSFNLISGGNSIRIDTTDLAGNYGFADIHITLDNTPPQITVFPLNHAVLNNLSVPVKIYYADSLSKINLNTMQVILDGKSITSSLKQYSDSALATLSLSQGLHNLSINLQDVLGNSVSYASNFTCSLPPPALTITSPANLTTVKSADILVKGQVNGTLSNLRIEGIPTVISNGNFETLAPLVDGRNTILATAINSDGIQVSATLTITLDREKPRIYITSPTDSLISKEKVLTVTGSVSDRIADIQGQSMPTIKVNGVDAKVVNNTFSALITVNSGLNTITAVATDRSGNFESAITHVSLDETQSAYTKVISGDNQTAPVYQKVAQPLVVKVMNAQGAPLASQTIIFHVTMGDGTLTGGKRTLQVQSDVNGLASSPFTLGKRAGPGANEVTVTSVGISNVVVFHANAFTQAAYRIFSASGDLQRGLAGSPAPHALAVLVTDSANNPIPGITVQFKVKKGGGHFKGFNLDSAVTGEDGRAITTFTLGIEEGRDNNIVEASFENNPSQPAVFVLSGYIPGPAAQTKVSGVILDNSNRPLKGVTVRIEESGQQTTTNSFGQYLFSNTPIGNLHLHVDGTTATQPGDWVTLMFEINAISGKNNDIGMPMYLVARNNAEGKVSSASTDQVITVADVPGFSLKVLAGSATFPPDVDDHTISVTAVHADKIPMPPGEGMQPRFIVSIGPPQVKFDPPAPITFPNVDGLKPGEQTHFYSFDHDLGTYVSIGTGTVSEDGTTVTSDKGFGIVKGGWHCDGPPSPTGNCKNCSVEIEADDASKKFVTMGDPFTINVTQGTAPGTMVWKGYDELVSSSNNKLVARFKSVGKKKITGEWTCKSGAKVTKTVEIKSAFPRITVVGWIEAKNIIFPKTEDVNPKLITKMNTFPLLEILEAQWLLDNPIELNSPYDIRYANAYLIYHSSNKEPPDFLSETNLLHFVKKGDFRLVGNIRAFLDVKSGKFTGEFSTEVKPIAEIGNTPLPGSNGYLSVPAEVDPINNGKNGFNTTHDEFHFLTEGRIGATGQIISYTINARTVPWIYSDIELHTDGSYKVISNIFPSIYVYREGILVETRHQTAENLEAFIQLDEASRRSLPK